MLIYENQYYQNRSAGFAVVEFPFAAGLHKSKGCTRTDLVQSKLNSKGGLRIRLKLSQAGSFCFWPFYSATITFKSPTNPTTQIAIDSEGQVAYYPINGGAINISQSDGISTFPPLKLGIKNDQDTTYFAVRTGAIQAESSNGQKAIAQSGQMAVVSPAGVQILALPEPDYRYEPFMGRSPLNPYTHGKVFYRQPNQVFVNGRPVKPGAVVWVRLGSIEVRSPAD